MDQRDGQDEQRTSLASLGLMFFGFVEAVYGLSVTLQGIAVSPIYILAGLVLIGCGVTIILAGLGRVDRGGSLYAAIGIGTLVLLTIALRLFS